MRRNTIGTGIWIILAVVMVWGQGINGVGSSPAAAQTENQQGAGIGGAGEENLKTEKQPELDILFVLDNSGSMKKNDPEFITRTVVMNFLEGLDEGARLGMVIFDENARLVESLTDIKDPAAVPRFLGGLDRMNYKGKYTNTPAGVERAIYELKSFGRAEAQKVIILLTDGIVDTGNKAQDLEKAEWLRQDLSSESKDAGIRIFGIAFTDNADFSLIQTLASRTGGEYFRAYTAEDIPAVFEKITVVITRPAFKKEMPAPPAPKLPPPETKVFVPSQAAPDAATSVKEEKALLPLILSAVAVGLLVILVVLAFKRKPADQVPQSVPEKLVEEELPPDHPIFKAELIDVDHIVSDETLSLTLNKLLVTIGRDDNNDIVIPKDSISSLHASIDYRNGYFYLEDHRSTNGTRLNHKDLEENKPVRLKSGDKIHFAVYEFRFLLPDQAPFGETVFLSKDDM